MRSAACAAWLAANLLACGSREDLVLGRYEQSDYTLVRHDDFDQLDLDFWELATHTFDPNLAYFTTDSAKVEQGLLVLSITAQPSPAMPMPMQVQKPYSAAELRTRGNYLYGSYRARVRVAAGPGVVTAFWGFYDRYSQGTQIDNQIVVESAVARTGNAPSLRYAVNVPMAAPEPAQQPTGVDLSTAFHELGYDWTPTEVRFYLDGQTTLVIGGDVARQLTQYQRSVLSAYPSQAGWISDFDPKQLPLRAEFDWVEIRAFNGARP